MSPGEPYKFLQCSAITQPDLLGQILGPLLQLLSWAVWDDVWLNKKHLRKGDCSNIRVVLEIKPRLDAGCSDD